MLKINSSVNIPYYNPWKYFHHRGIDLTMLNAFSVLTAIVIVTTNGSLLAKLLLKKDKVRADKLFVILCFSDISVRVFALPSQSVVLFSPNLETVCSLHKFLAFANFP